MRRTIMPPRLQNHDDTREADRSSDGMLGRLGDAGANMMAPDITTGNNPKTKLTQQTMRETLGQLQVLSETQKPSIFWQPVYRCSPFYEAPF